MNNGSFQSFFKRFGFRLERSIRWLSPSPATHAFGASPNETSSRIEQIYVINLDRQKVRWQRMQRELTHIRSSYGAPLLSITTRVPAIDAKLRPEIPADEVDPFYNLSEQLFVEPEPLLPGARADANPLIRMSGPEIAVAKSHIETWKRIAASSHTYSLVLEDDGYFSTNSEALIDAAWAEIQFDRQNGIALDMLYLSYREAGLNTEKRRQTSSLFEPVRGLWQMSGYVLSREGAKKLLDLLPIRGPVDLWINYQYEKIRVLATSRSVINQRPDAGSDNKYSILPILSTAGVLSNEKPNLFKKPTGLGPIFVWSGSRDGADAEALVMALSMLGYRCCSGIGVPSARMKKAFLDRRASGPFDVYVQPLLTELELREIMAKNLAARIVVLHQVQSKTNAPTVVSDDQYATRSGVDIDYIMSLGAIFDVGERVLILSTDHSDKWTPICAFLRCDAPEADYPNPSASRLGIFSAPSRAASLNLIPNPTTALKFDSSPWILPYLSNRQTLIEYPWTEQTDDVYPLALHDQFKTLDPAIWDLLEDTFPGNRSLFTSNNVSICDDGLRLTFREEPAQVRQFTSGSIRTSANYLYGRFEAELKPARCAGMITGIFLHRYFPRQEIDIELLGKDTTKLLINVYYNPGDVGAELNYGHRGTPVLIDLGYDAAEAFHRYAIEWTPTCIKWFVDDILVHERSTWNPTPIPHLPMQLFINLWSAHSVELAGKLARSKLPADTYLKSVIVHAAEINSLSGLSLEESAASLPRTDRLSIS